MNDLYKDKLAVLDDYTIKAIEAVFLEQTESTRPMIDGADDFLLGQRFRAYENSKAVVDKAIKTIISYRANKQPKKSFNKAR